MERRTFIKSAAAAFTMALLTPTTLLASDGAGPSKKHMNVLGEPLAYVEQGEGRPVVFLHGNPSSSFVWRNIIPHVAKTNRAIAPDLMGMGDSGKPSMEETYKESSQYLFRFLDNLELENAVLVVHDWGSGLGFEYARTRPEKISGVVFMEAMTPPFIPYPSYEAMGGFADFMRAVRTPGVGEDMIMEQNMLLDQFMRHGSPNGAISEAVMAEYNRYYPNTQSRKILLDWIREIPIAGSPAYVSQVAEANNAWLLESDLPKLMLHVSPGAIISMEQAKTLQKSLTNLESVYLGPGGHFVQEDYPEEIGRAISDWIQKL
ncbi:haloalkane dehalogenase [Pseudovibrio denitrificans]|uniref:Haloalkane dehalogenase n=1 Tax=Pseudovibrio denitrificans TaxID=258256 RepID=A0A1I7CRQ3_9HYPH|nr:haloalkane dehalogenase [Pseudovibrio denitrificans]SFU02092.1 haloalkane dehalogenase [Pseudovibrio denitrificans]